MAGRKDTGKSLGEEYWKRHLKYMSASQRKVDAAFDEAVRKLVSICEGLTLADGEDFAFSSAPPAVRKQAGKVLKTLATRLEAIVLNGIDAEWTLANNKNSELSRRVFGENAGRLSQRQYERYFTDNQPALDEFRKQKTGGLGISDRVWKYTDKFKEEIEMGLELGIGERLSAADMASELKQYLRHPDKLFRRVRDEKGQLRLSKAAMAYHPGQGVYRSSYMNARRLAATETNIAYHTADYLRWQEMDFVVGIKVGLSNNHPVPDICDDLAGLYPKDFKFTGWHPHCRCHATTVMKTDEELEEDTRRIMRGEEPSENSVNSVRELPENFKKWAEKNEGKARNSHSLPYFLQDNKGMLNGYYLDKAIKETMARARLSGSEVQKLAEEIANRFGATCTPINFKGAESISRKVLFERGEHPTLTPDSLKDTVRTTIVVPRNSIPGVISMLEKSDLFLRHKTQITSLGYTGHIVNIRTKNGTVGEIQVNTPKMIYAKEKPAEARRILGEDLWNKIREETRMEGGLGHKFYEAYRVLDPESAEAKQILRQSYEYYKHFKD